MTSAAGMNSDGQYLQNARRPTAQVIGVWDSGGERRPGRAVRRWIDDILVWCGQVVQQAVMMIVDRDNWRRFVVSPYGPC